MLTKYFCNKCVDRRIIFPGTTYSFQIWETCSSGSLFGNFIRLIHYTIFLSYFTGTYRTESANRPNNTKQQTTKKNIDGKECNMNFSVTSYKRRSLRALHNSHSKRVTESRIVLSACVKQFELQLPVFNLFIHSCVPKLQFTK